MKGKINSRFNLEIYREGRGRWQEVWCPLSQGDDKCGDWCALFGEPNKVSFYRGNAVPREIKLTVVKLCHKKLYFEEFADERGEVRG